MENNNLNFAIQILEEHFENLEFLRNKQRDDCIFIVEEIRRNPSTELTWYYETAEKTSSLKTALEILKKERGF